MVYRQGLKTNYRMANLGTTPLVNDQIGQISIKNMMTMAVPYFDGFSWKIGSVNHQTVNYFLPIVKQYRESWGNHICGILYHKCGIVYYICGVTLPHMWYSIPQLWYIKKYFFESSEEKNMYKILKSVLLL